MKLNKKEIDRIISFSLREDIGSGDITTNSIVTRDKKSCASFYVKEPGIVAGLTIAKSVFKKLDNSINWKNFVKDGDRVAAGTKIASISGSLRAILTGERTALNFLQHLSGVATATSHFAKCTNSTNAQILDTRKTVPGLRLLDKYAVLTGGGKNHRFGLYDMVLIKDNHIKIAGSIAAAVDPIRKKLRKKFMIEVEATNLEEVHEALNSKVDIIMLDNMPVDLMKEAVTIAGGKAKIEASGNVTLENIREIAETGVDYISAGALTHSVKALDINMKIDN